MTAPLHDTLAFERVIDAPPVRVFDTFTSRDAREDWGAPSKDEVYAVTSSDLRPGGREVAACGPKSNPAFTVTTDWIRLDGPDRIVFTETVEEGATLCAVSLTTAEFAEANGGTSLRLYMSYTSFVGREMIDGHGAGWAKALTNLDRLAARALA